MTLALVQARALAAAALACMAWWTHADAGDVYRCVDADHRIEYRDWPCAGQNGSRIDVLPNVASEIDQSAARAANAAITDRTARRMAEQGARALQGAPPPSPVTETGQPWWWVGGGAERERRRDRDRPEKRRLKSPRQPSIAPNVAPLHRP